MTTQQRMFGPSDVITRYCESTTVAEGAVLVVGAADNNVALPAGADAVVPMVGIAKSALTAAGYVDIVISGIFPGIANGAVTRGDKLVIAGTDGSVKTAAPGAGTNDMVVGEALASAASGERVSMRIKGYLMQG